MKNMKEIFWIFWMCNGRVNPREVPLGKTFDKYLCVGFNCYAQDELIVLIDLLSWEVQFHIEHYENINSKRLPSFQTWDKLHCIVVEQFLTGYFWVFWYLGKNMCFVILACNMNRSCWIVILQQYSRVCSSYASMHKCLLVRVLDLSY